MKVKTLKVKTLTAVAALVVSSSALAVTPANYDTRFNVSANVPDSIMISDPGGRPMTDIDVVMRNTHESGNKMMGTAESLRLWSNNVTQLDVALTLDDGESANGGLFTLYSSSTGTLIPMTYRIRALTTNGSHDFVYSGDTRNFTLTAEGNHAALPIEFKFVSDADYNDLINGSYAGVVYANVVART